MFENYVKSLIFFTDALCANALLIRRDFPRRHRSFARRLEIVHFLLPRFRHDLHLFMRHVGMLFDHRFNGQVQDDRRPQIHRQSGFAQKHRWLRQFTIFGHQYIGPL